MFVSGFCLVNKHTTFLRWGSRILAMAVVLVAFVSPTMSGLRSDFTASQGASRGVYCLYGPDLNMVGSVLELRSAAGLSYETPARPVSNVSALHAPDSNTDQQDQSAVSLKHGRTIVGSRSDDNKPRENSAKPPFARALTAHMTKARMALFDLYYRSPRIVRKLAPPI